MTGSMLQMKLDKTRRGDPAIWESGGGMSNTGRATIVADADGSPLPPIYIRGRGHLACGNHALFLAKPGMVIIQAAHHRRDFSIDVYVIRSITTDQDGEYQADVTRIASFDEGMWAPEKPLHLADAIAAARNKALSYHCRTPFFYEVPPAQPKPSLAQQNDADETQQR